MTNQSYSIPVKQLQYEISCSKIIKLLVKSDLIFHRGHWAFLDSGTCATTHLFLVHKFVRIMNINHVSISVNLSCDPPMNRVKHHKVIVPEIILFLGQPRLIALFSAS